MEVDKTECFEMKESDIETSESEASGLTESAMSDEDSDVVCLGSDDDAISVSLSDTIKLKWHKIDEADAETDDGVTVSPDAGKNINPSLEKEIMELLMSKFAEAMDKSEVGRLTRKVKELQAEKERMATDQREMAKEIKELGKKLSLLTTEPNKKPALMVFNRSVGQQTPTEWSRVDSATQEINRAEKPTGSSKKLDLTTRGGKPVYTGANANFRQQLSGGVNRVDQGKRARDLHHARSHNSSAQYSTKMVRVIVEEETPATVSTAQSDHPFVDLTEDDPPTNSSGLQQNSASSSVETPIIIGGKRYVASNPVSLQRFQLVSPAFSKKPFVAGSGQIGQVLAQQLDVASGPQAQLAGSKKTAPPRKRSKGPANATVSRIAATASSKAGTGLSDKRQ